MGETSTFLSLTLVVSATVFACILQIRSVSVSKAMARSFYIASAVLSLGALLWILLDATGILPAALESAKLLQVLIYRAWIVIGTALPSALLLLIDMRADTSVRITDATRSFAASPHVWKGVCLSVAISFIGTEVGKIAHESDMRQFFLQSGYPVWFLYFIITAETFGAICLFFRRTQLAAAFGLILIMAGAIRTHLHNGDPFSDSLEALHLLMLLVCIVLFRLVAEKSSLSPPKPVRETDTPGGC